MSARTARRSLAALIAVAVAASLAVAPRIARADQAAPAARVEPTSPASIDACDPARTARLQRVLRDEARAASRWRWAWAGVYGVAAVGQVAFAQADLVPEGDRHHAQLVSLYLGAGKATIGLAARLVIPPKIARPALTGDPCTDARAMRTAIARTARAERTSMALNVLGGLSLNVGTSLWLGLREDSWADAGISFGMGTVVSLLSAFTQPRRVWRRGGVAADGPLVLGAAITPWRHGRAHGLSLTGAF